jgi:hypothetical protein
LVEPKHQYRAEYRTQALDIFCQDIIFPPSASASVEPTMLDPVDPGDGSGEPNQSHTVELIGPAEAVDDAGDGGVCFRIPLVVGEMEICSIFMPHSTDLCPN